MVRNPYGQPLLLGSMYFWSWLIQLNRSYKYNENIARTGISTFNGNISKTVQNFEKMVKIRCNYFSILGLDRWFRNFPKCVFGHFFGPFLFFFLLKKIPSDDLKINIFGNKTPKLWQKKLNWCWPFFLTWAHLGQKAVWKAVFFTFVWIFFLIWVHATSSSFSKLCGQSGDPWTRLCTCWPVLN